MARLIGVFADAPVSLAQVVRRLSGGDTMSEAGGRWGCAYVREGEVLLTQRLLQLGGTVAAALVDTVSQAAVEQRWTAADAPQAPRRFGPWMWAWRGALGASDLQVSAASAQLPDSLRRNLSRPTAEGRLFHQILAALKAARVKLACWGPPLEPVVEAIHQTLARWRADFGRIEGRFVLATERRAFAAALGRPLGVGSWRHEQRGLVAVPEGAATVWTFIDLARAHAQPLEAGTVLALDGERARRFDLSRGAWR